jgi:broad specificity phosphatase PhoE
VLYLVRHALPDHRSDVASTEWELSEEGQRDAQSLVQRLRGCLLVASTEAKARQTLEPCGAVATDARFREVERDDPYDDGFRERRRAYLAGSRRPGWEPHTVVAARFESGVRHWAELAAGRSLAIGTHGMAMTIWLASHGLTDPVGFWERLRFPDVIEVPASAEQLQAQHAGEHE